MPRSTLIDDLSKVTDLLKSGILETPTIKDITNITGDIKIFLAPDNGTIDTQSNLRLDFYFHVERGDEIAVFLTDIREPGEIRDAWFDIKDRPVADISQAKRHYLPSE